MRGLNKGHFTLAEKQDDLRRRGLTPLFKAEAARMYDAGEVDAYFALLERREPETGTTYLYYADRTEIRLNGRPVFSIHPLATDDEVFGAILGFNAAVALIAARR